MMVHMIIVYSMNYRRENDMDNDNMNVVSEDNGMNISVLIYRLEKKKKKIKKMSFCDSLVKLG